MSDRPWYRKYPSDWLHGTSVLTQLEKNMYQVLVDLMYDRWGPIPNDPQWIRGLAGRDCSLQCAKRLINALIECGKIYVTDDGRLFNKRADKEIEWSAKNAKVCREAGANGGQKSAETRAKVGRELAENPEEIQGFRLGNNDLAEQRLQAVPDTIYQNVHSPSENVVPDLVQRAFDDYNKLAAELGLPRAAKLDPGRRRKIEMRLSEHGGLDAWTLALANIRESSFLRGDKGDWRASLDFLCQQSSFRKVAEGAYNRGKAAGNQLPLLRQIDGGVGNAGPVDDYGIEAFCKSLPGVTEVTDPKYLHLGRWEYQTIMIASVAQKIAKACRFNRSSQIDWTPLAKWLDLRIQSDVILGTIGQMAERMLARHDPPGSLRVFDAAILRKRAAA